MPLYVLGAAGAARRTQAFMEPAFRPWLYVAGIGALILLTALASLFVQLWVSIRDRAANRVFAGDPWDGRGLEWSVSAPPPELQLRRPLPRSPGATRSSTASARASPTRRPRAYEDIELPRNSATGPVIGIVGAALAFGLVWHIWWLADPVRLIGDCRRGDRPQLRARRAPHDHRRRGRADRPALARCNRSVARPIPRRDRDDHRQ